MNAKYGADPGQKSDTHVSNQFAPFPDSHEHYTDTGGATDLVFALSHLLGWTHISLTGDYLWREPAACVDDFLPLRLNERLSVVA